VFKNGIPGKETVKGRFAALLPEVCREKAVISDQSSVVSDQSSVFSATGGPRFIFGASSVLCQWPVVQRVSTTEFLRCR
jgi:hypothetical protein